MLFLKYSDSSYVLKFHIRSFLKNFFFLQEAAITLRDKVASVISQVDDRWRFDEAMDENAKRHILKLYRETMLQAYNFGFEVIFIKKC